MNKKEEYHDPDYPELPSKVKEEPQSESEDDRINKIKKIIRREFTNELEARENEIMIIDQRMMSSRRLLQKLRYAIVNRYYNNMKLQMTNGQIQDEIAVQKDPRAKADISSLFREGQRNIHPSVRKLLGKKTVDLSEIFKTRSPRNKTRKDYSAMLQKRNYTISADSTKSLRPDNKSKEKPDNEEPSGSKPKKIPRHIDPKITNVVTVDEITRNKMKYRYRITIGNTSKYVPPASKADKSTHKWLLYIRGAATPDLTHIVSAVTVRLHHSYAPHHVVHLEKPPFHITRRGWGEFPARVELHFALPERNRPVSVEHTITLDKNCTGMQVLGAETIVDVWLYSTPEMLPYEFKDEETETETISQSQSVTIPQSQIETHLESAIHTEIKIEKIESPESTMDWMEFLIKEPSKLKTDEIVHIPDKQMELESIQKETVKSEPDWSIENNEDIENIETVTSDELPNELINQTASLKKRIVKYIDHITGKIYYLEMDRNLDLTKVQEIVINNTTAKISPIKSNGLKNYRKKKGVSLLKPEVKSLLKTENSKMNNFNHIQNDHCYLASTDFDKPIKIKQEPNVIDDLRSVICRFSSVRMAVNYLLKKIPIVSDMARDPDFSCTFPFVVEDNKRFWKLDFAKRRNIEWSRAKFINTLLKKNFSEAEPIWRTKQILVFSRLHGYYPIRNEQTDTQDTDWWNDTNIGSNLEPLYPEPKDINTLSIFDKDSLQIDTDVPELDSSDVDIDVVSDSVVVKSETVKDSEPLTVLPVESEEDRLRFMYLEKKCSDIGIDLRCEDVGNGYSYSAVHAVLLSAMKSCAEELTRSALACRLREQHGPDTVWTGSSSSRSPLLLRHVSQAVKGRLKVLTAADTATTKKERAPL